MAQLLDDEEPAPSPDEELVKKKAPGEEMFDDTEGDDGGLDIDDDDPTPDEGVDPPEIDEF